MPELLAQKQDFDAWGVATGVTGAAVQALGYVGGLADTLTGLERFGARDYDAGVGRWTCRDPIVSPAIWSSTYSYADNLPVTSADPTGLCTLQLGLTLSATLPNGFSATVFAGLAFDCKGGFGTYFGGGAGVGVGIGALGGGTVLVSNGRDIHDLRGPFNQIGIGGGTGSAGAAEAFYGTTRDGRPILGAGGTFGGGLGVTSFDGGTYTVVNYISKAPAAPEGSRLK